MSLDIIEGSVGGSVSSCFSVTLEEHETFILPSFQNLDLKRKPDTLLESSKLGPYWSHCWTVLEFRMKLKAWHSILYNLRAMRDETFEGHRTCHPQICLFGIKTILSQRYLRKSRYKKSSLPSIPHLPRSRTQICNGVPSTPLYQEEETLIKEMILDSYQLIHSIRGIYTTN